MIRATELAGRAVVDIDAAEKVGTIDKMILDPEARRVAGFLVTRARSGFPGSKSHAVIPSEAVHAVGPDAVTIRQSAVAGTDTARLEALPKGSDIIGRKVVSEEGRFMGKVDDVLINDTDGHIVGYVLSEHTPRKKLEPAAGGDKKRRETPYLPADAKIKAGRDLIVASEESVNYEWIDDEDSGTGESGTPIHKWGYGAPASPIEAGISSDTNPRVR